MLSKNGGVITWDPNDYGQDIDFSRSFFEQFKELQNKVPRLALLNKNNINSDYSNHSNNSKDVYMCATAFDSENVLYSTNVIPLKNSLDVYRAEGKSNENLYECINVHDCFNCQFCYKVESSFDCTIHMILKIAQTVSCLLTYVVSHIIFEIKNIQKKSTLKK
jgi:hypothetical protein